VVDQTSYQGTSAPKKPAHTRVRASHQTYERSPNNITTTHQKRIPESVTPHPTYQPKRCRIPVTSASKAATPCILKKKNSTKEPSHFRTPPMAHRQVVTAGRDSQKEPKTDLASIRKATYSKPTATPTK